MNINFLQKVGWNALKALSYNIAGFCILIMFCEETSFYFQFTPHILFALGCIGHYKASKCELRIIRQGYKNTAPLGAVQFSKSLTKEFEELKLALHKNVSCVTIIAGFMSPIELLRSLGKASRGESAGIDKLLGITLSTILLMLGILWYYSIKRDRQEE